MNEILLFVGIWWIVHNNIVDPYIVINNKYLLGLDPC